MRAYDYDVVVVGELNADLILSGDVTPAFGQVERLVDGAILTLGSSSAIFACGAARLGLRVAFVGKVGDDEFGRFVLRALHERGVDTTGVTIDSHIPTGLSVILTRPSDRAILTFPGSIAALHYDEIDQELIERARHLHLGSYFLLDALRPDVPKLFERAHAKSLSTSLDTNYDPAERWDGLDELWPHVDLFLPNETELYSITQTSDIANALERMSKRVPIVAVKCGAQGGVVQHGTQVEHAAPPPVAVVDTTGAGDSFDAGFVYGYLARWDLARTLRLACTCGALSTRAAGGTPAQATLEEAEKVMI